MPLVACPKCDYEFDARVASCPKCGEVVTSFVRQHAGTLVDGKYRVLKRLGRGGMGEVFKAEHIHLGTTRVIKVMRPQIADDKELQTRFLREAKLATLIQHPNVATLHDFSVLPDQTCYMVWEYIDGTDLSTYAKSGEHLGTRAILELAVQTLRGLQAVHEAGIVHRDISPENIMVSPGPSGATAKLIDLGIAKSDSADSSLTSTGVFIGKWRYASPEHLGLLEPGETIDGRADIFSLGIVLYELLTGDLPFKAETPGQYVLLHTGNRPNPVSPENISVPDAPGLENVLAKMLARDRSERFSSASEVVLAIEGVLRSMHELDEAPPTMVLTPTPSSAEEVPTERLPTPPSADRTEWAERSSSSRALIAIAAIAGALAIVIAVVLVVAVIRMRRGEPVVPRARLAKTVAEPAGETVEIPVEESEASSAAPERDEAEPAVDDAAPVEPATAEPEPVVTEPPASAAKTTPTKTVPPEATGSKAAPATTTSQPTPPPARSNPTPDPVQEAPAAVTPAPTKPASDRIPTSGERMFGRRSRRLVDDTTYLSGFRRGIIRDYGDMWSRGGLDWVALAKGVRLADHHITVSKFRNLTEFEDPAMMRYLNEVLQTELDDVTEPGETLTTENAIFWAQEAPRHGIGIEMIFRDSSGRVVAKLRHVHFEDSLEDAAQEMVDYVVEFVEDHDVVE